jgi:hypothetical protein
MVVGAITIGIGYSILRDYVFHKEEHEKGMWNQYIVINYCLNSTGIILYQF